MNNKECIEDLKNGDLYDEKGFVSENGYAVLCCTVREKETLGGAA